MTGSRGGSRDDALGPDRSVPFPGLVVRADTQDAAAKENSHVAYRVVGHGVIDAGGWPGYRSQGPRDSIPLPRLSAGRSGDGAAPEKHRDAASRVVRHGEARACRWTADGSLGPGDSVPFPGLITDAIDHAAAEKNGD